MYSSKIILIAVGKVTLFLSRTLSGFLPAVFYATFLLASFRNSATFPSLFITSSLCLSDIPLLVIIPLLIIPSNLIAFEDKPMESLFIDLNLQNTKILTNCSYNTHKSEMKRHLTALRNYLDLHSSKYEKILILGDFDTEVEEPNKQSFCKNYNLKRLIKQPTCYEGPKKLTCIVLILRNVPRMFQSTCVIETEPSDFHLMTAIVITKTFKKIRPGVINYRSYRDFSNEAFRTYLINNLSKRVFY